MKVIKSEMTHDEVVALEAESMLWVADRARSEDFIHDYIVILDVHNNAYDFIEVADEDQHDSMCAVVFFIHDYSTGTYATNCIGFYDSYVSAVRAFAEQLVIDYCD